MRSLKERIRSTVHGLPFKRLPKLMLMEIAKKGIQDLNMFPNKNSVCKHTSPVSLITGQQTPNYNAMKIEFGSYAQVFEDNDPTNTNKARTLGAIALTSTGNENGDHYFMSLSTGARISRRNWTELPITDIAIARVEALAVAEGQPLIQERGLVVEWRPGHTIDDDEYDRDYVPNDDEENHEEVDNDMQHYDPIDDAELEDIQNPPVYIPDDGEHNLPNGEDDNNNQPFPDDLEEPGAQGEPVAFNEAPAQGAGTEDEDHEDNMIADEPQGANVYQEQGANAGQDQDANNYMAGTEHHGEQRERYNLRDRMPRGRTFAEAIDEPHSAKSYYEPHQFLQTEGNADSTPQPTSIERFIFGFVMTQMSAKAGIKKHGRVAEEALMAEFAQLEDLEVFEALDPSVLTRQQKVGALRAINLIKEKRDGRLKGRTVADGRPQRFLYSKAETASPTVSADALILSLMIDAKEGRDVATADVAGAYLKADMDDFVIMKLSGRDVEIFCEMNDDYSKFVVIENGQKVLYVRLLKALYGCVKSALLWYRLFTEHLQHMGFTLNPYDPCVANATIDGKQCTIAWYVDDNKVSHKDSRVVDRIIELIEERFGKMTVTRGKRHVFLGMHFEMMPNGTVEISMSDYLREAIEESGLHVARGVATPAKKSLFEVDLLSPMLSRKDSERFHSVVAKLLYVAPRARMDILLPTIFLCTRVAKATKQDQEKLRRLLEYLYGSMHLKFTLGADSLNSFRTWVDASFAVHPDMRSHTGGVISFGNGGVLCKSSKQKLNTKSSTEAELVGASDYLPNTIWVKLFMEAQGHPITECLFEQDNEAAIKLETNGRASCSSKTRHVSIRYFFVKDRARQENIAIRHCPTLRMLADFFTKPLQGALFRKFRDVILGYAHINSLSIAVSNQERVGEGSFDDDTVSSTDREQPQPHDTDWVEVIPKKVKKIRSKSNGGETRSFD